MSQVHLDDLAQCDRAPDVQFLLDQQLRNQTNAQAAEDRLDHYGGMITFGPDGFLYIGKGDGGWEGDPLNAGQNLNTLLAKILRIDVDTPDDMAYKIPKDNPMAKADRTQLMSLFGITEQGFTANQIGSRPEMWAYGLRNPYSFHFNPRTNDLFIADVGQNHWEEIDWQPAASKGGENYGWKFNQGSHCHPTTGPGEKCPIVGVLPVAEYPHQEPYPGAPKETKGYGCSVQGLGVANYGGLKDTYLAGDWCTGNLYGVAWDEATKKWVMQVFGQTNLRRRWLARPFNTRSQRTTSACFLSSTAVPLVRCRRFHGERSRRTTC